MARRYVDNAANRRLGRVGQLIGTHVQRQEDNQPRQYVDNDMNRRLGRVGMIVGECVHRRGEPIPQRPTTSPAQDASHRFYANNDVNRRLGRAGMPLGEHVVHRQGEQRATPVHSERRSDASSHPPERFYADNNMNRRLGRIGMPVGGEHVHRRGEPVPQHTTAHPVRRQDASSHSPPERFYADNDMNRRLGRVGMPAGEHVHRRGEPIPQHTTAYPLHSETQQDASSHSPPERFYADNDMNRRLGRVGMPVGEHVHKRGEPIPQHTIAPPLHSETRQNASTHSPPERFYADNAMNRRLGRVGMPVGEHVHRRGEPIPQHTTAPTLRSERRQNGSSYPPDAVGDHVHRGHNPPQHVNEPQRRRTASQLPPATRPAISITNPSRDGTQSPMPTSPRRSQTAAYHADSINHRVDTAQSREISSEASSATVRDSDVTTSCPVEEQDFAPTTDNVHSTTKNKIPVSEIQLMKTILGAGNIGTVYDGNWRSMRIAFKKFNFQRRSEKWAKVLELEMKSLCQLSHPNIVKLYGPVLDRGSIGIVMEYLPHSLHQAVFAKGQKFSQDDKQTIIKHVCEGLIFLHSLEITHCNLTSKNIILSDHKFAKIGNYGLEFVKSEADPSNNYASPEILHIRPLNSEQKKKCDVYSLGILTYEVFEAKEPYKNLRKDLSSPIIAANYIMQPHILDITRSCVTAGSEERPSAQQFLVKWEDHV